MSTMSEVMPAVAAPTRSASPLVVPPTVKRPARRPLVSVLARIKDMFGPGVRPRTMQVAMKAASTSGDIGFSYVNAEGDPAEDLMGRRGASRSKGSAPSGPACPGALIEPRAGG